MREPLDTELVYLFDVRPTVPTMHYRHSCVSTRTRCRLPTEAALAQLQYRHAVQFARPCSRCLSFPPA